MYRWLSQKREIIELNGFPAANHKWYMENGYEFQNMVGMRYFDELLLVDGNFLLLKTKEMFWFYLNWRKISRLLFVFVIPC